MNSKNEVVLALQTKIDARVMKKKLSFRDQLHTAILARVEEGLQCCYNKSDWKVNLCQSGIGKSESSPLWQLCTMHSGIEEVWVDKHENVAGSIWDYYMEYYQFEN